MFGASKSQHADIIQKCPLLSGNKTGQMRERILYFSNYDMSMSYYLQYAEEVITRYHNGWRPDDINDAIELYNIWLFAENGITMISWTEETKREVYGYKEDVAYFFKGLKSPSWTIQYEKVTAEYRKYFWEIIDRFNISGLIDVETLRKVFLGNSHELIYLLKRERLVKKYDKLLAELVKQNENTPEWLLSEYVGDNRSSSYEHVFFPASFTLKDKEKSISAYLDLPEPNLNYVRLVLETKKDQNLRLSDDVILKAKKVERKLNDKYFNKETGFHLKYSICINGNKNKPLKWVERDEEGNPILCYSKELMLKHKGAELLHYCIFGFEFLTMSGMINLISRTSESGTFERLIGLNGRFSYPLNMAFRYNEAISMLQIEGMQNVLQTEGMCMEVAIKDFYERYLKEKFGYPSVVISLPETTSDWVSKCRIIAPEIDRIAKRHDMYAKRGVVDEELLGISTDTVRVTDVTSCVKHKYYTIKGQPNALLRLFHLLFSDQSMLSFVEPFKNYHYSSFFQLLMKHNGKIPYNNYANYQQRDIDYLVEEGFLAVNTEGCLFVVKQQAILLLKQLYEFHSFPTMFLGGFDMEFFNMMLDKGWIEEDNNLLSIEERNYFDYYMYNSPYTNGPALRNRYVHGTNVDPSQEHVHKAAYDRLLILLILELLKIEDDLIRQQLLIATS